MSRWRRIAASKPLQFLLGGLLLYVFWGNAAPVAVPEPVVLDAAALAQLRAAWTAAMGREPTAGEFAAMQKQEMDDEVLFREAIALGLDRRDEVVRQRILLNMRFLGAAPDASDEALLEQARAMDMTRNDLVIRRRLVQVMEFSLSQATDETPATEAELQSMYTAHREEFAQPPRWQLVQVYFSADRRGTSAEADARAALQRFTREDTDPADAIAAGDPFLGGHRLPSLGAPQLAAQFGQVFVDALPACAARAWCGPVRSAFGAHLVWIDEHQPAHTPGLDDPSVRRRVESDVRRAREKARLDEAMIGLRRKYGVGA